MVVVCVKGGGGWQRGRACRGWGGRTQRDSVNGNEQRGKSKTHGPAVCERRVFFFFFLFLKIFTTEKL